jgi:spore cortex formation protein SpoVR/YcgB (stage V sporulation)
MQNLRWANEQHIGVCYDTAEAVVYVDGGELYQEIITGKHGPIGEPIVINVEVPKPTNDQVREFRRQAYELEADPIYFMAQRSEATLEEWQAKITEIKERYPYYFDDEGNLLESKE